MPIYNVSVKLLPHPRILFFCCIHNYCSFPLYFNANTHSKSIKTYCLGGDKLCQYAKLQFLYTALDSTYSFIDVKFWRYSFGLHLPLQYSVFYRIILAVFKSVLIIHCNISFSYRNILNCFFQVMLFLNEKINHRI